MAEDLSVGVGGAWRGAIYGKVYGGQMSRIVGFAAGRDIEDGVEAAVACLVVHLDLIILDFCNIQF